MLVLSLKLLYYWGTTDWLPLCATLLPHTRVPIVHSRISCCMNGYRCGYKSTRPWCRPRSSRHTVSLNAVLSSVESLHNEWQILEQIDLIWTARWFWHNNARSLCVAYFISYDFHCVKSIFLGSRYTRVWDRQLHVSSIMFCVNGSLMAQTLLLLQKGVLLEYFRFEYIQAAAYCKLTNQV